MKTDFTLLMITEANFTTSYTISISSQKKKKKLDIEKWQISGSIIILEWLFPQYLVWVTPSFYSKTKEMTWGDLLTMTASTCQMKNRKALNSTTYWQVLSWRSRPCCFHLHPCRWWRTAALGSWSLASGQWWSPHWRCLLDGRETLQSTCQSSGKLKLSRYPFPQNYLIALTLTWPCWMS